MIASAVMCGPPRADHDRPVPGSLTVSRSRPREKGVRGVDGRKPVTGRNRHILVETLGLRLAVAVTAASVQDRDGATPLLGVLRHKLTRLRSIWADQAYAGDLLAWVWSLRPWRNVRLKMVKRPEGTKGFQRLPKRWMVGRTFGWFGLYRRLSKDDEYCTRTSETMIRVAMVHLMVRRLARLVCCYTRSQR